MLYIQNSRASLQFKDYDRTDLTYANTDIQDNYLSLNSVNYDLIMPEAQSKQNQFIFTQSTFYRGILGPQKLKISYYRSDKPDIATVNNDVLSDQIAICNLPISKSYSKKDIFVAVWIDKAKLKIATFRSNTDVVSDLSKVQVTMVQNGFSDVDDMVDQTGTISLQGRVSNKGEVILDAVVPLDKGIRHFSFKVETVQATFSATLISTQYYEIKPLDNYTCKLTMDYLLCMGNNGGVIPYEYSLGTNTWLHVIRRKDSTLKGDGKSVTTFPLNDSLYPPVLPKNQVVVQNYAENIMTYIEPNTRRLVTGSVVSIEDMENKQFWTVLSFGTVGILLFLTVSTLAGKKYGAEKDWDKIRGDLGLKPVGGVYEVKVPKSSMEGQSMENFTEKLINNSDDVISD